MCTQRLAVICSWKGLCRDGLVVVAVLAGQAALQQVCSMPQGQGSWSSFHVMQA